MPKVICKLPNASTEISGVKFTADEDGAMLSEDVAQDVADSFALIPGYEIIGAKVTATPAPAKNSKTVATKKPAAPAQIAPIPDAATPDAAQAEPDQPEQGPDDAAGDDAAGEPDAVF